MYSEQGINNTINISTTSLTNATQLTVIGNNNSVYIGNNCKIVSSNIRLKGNNITLFIADDVENMGLVCSLHSDCSLQIQAKTTMGNGEITIAEKGKISIGKDCMLAHGYEIRNTDMHPIYSLENGERINHGKDVIIGNHVWLGRNVTILKGVCIPNNVVVGSHTVLYKSFKEPNCVIAGSPAKIVKENIVWGRKMYHSTMYDDPTLNEFYK
nr:hypothetical protein [Neisseria meningitidis]CCP19895.1 O-acetyltransferase [Neisseria meningitidis]